MVSSQVCHKITTKIQTFRVTITDSKRYVLFDFYISFYETCKGVYILRLTTS